MVRCPLAAEISPVPSGGIHGETGRLKRNTRRPLPIIAPSSTQAGAHRAAAFLCTGTGVHYGLPGVSFRADPPDLPIGAGGDHGWGQRAVEGGMPLGGDLG